MTIETIRWRNNCVELIDQRLLPATLKYIKCDTVNDMCEAIRKLKVRGAPAIGVAGAYGVYLGIRKSRASSFNGFFNEAKKAAERIACTRPTARNLFWALERMLIALEYSRHKSVKELKKILLKEADKILEEDKRICRSIGENGKKLIKKGTRILTHCNAGALATVDYGTALGVIFAAKKNIRRVYADETRPVLQGARLTAWELVKSGIKTTLICDNMAGTLMAQGEIDAVIVGADRIARNGDVANKIGTYPLAVLASYHGIPFYVAAPLSTFDFSISSGEEITIEERDRGEVEIINGKRISPEGVDVRNPAFDVTPARLVTAIITEKGVIRRPDQRKIAKLIGSKHK